MNQLAITSIFQDFEERELEWEQREVELERIIAQMERTQAEIAGAATQVSCLICHLFPFCGSSLLLLYLEKGRGRVLAACYNDVVGS